MKKIIKIFIISICLIPSICFADTIYNIDMDINIQKDGTASIKEVWTVKADSGSEWYKSMYNLGNSQLSDYKVSMDGKELTYKKWNVDENMESKKGYYGINYSNSGIELCFGKSDYKRHNFTISYKLSNYIFNTNDSQVLYWTLIPEINVNSFNVNVTSYYSFPKTLGVWGYGYKGYAYVKGGKISMSNDSALNENRVVLLTKFPTGTFDTNNSYSEYKTFNDVYNQAQEGTFEYDYGNAHNSKNNIIETITKIVFTIIPFFIVGFISLILIVALKPKYGYKDNKKINKKEVLPFREVPCNKDIYVANSIISLNNKYFNGYKDTNIFGAIILKWIKEDKVKINNITKGIFNKETSTIDLTLEPSFDNENEQLLFEYMTKASNDGILEPNELERWCKNNYSKFLDLFESISDDYIRKLEEDGRIYNRIDKSECKAKKIMDDTIYDDALKLCGLNKFLDEFSKIDERAAIEVKIWDEYLMFAYLFGNADKVAKQLKRLYPEVLQANNYDYDTILFVNNIAYIGYHSASSARSAAENYSAGGGGFSSGGGGFGSFGGGGSAGGR